MLELTEERVTGAWGESEPKDLELSGMPNHDDQRRALSWSSLTSGKAIHAFYVLLLPYMLCNAAGWTLPEVGEDRSIGLRCRIALTRLVGFLVTVQFATLLTLTGVDIVGRQAAVRSWASGVNDKWYPWAAAASVVLCGVIVVALALLTKVRPLQSNTDERAPRDPAGTASLMNNQKELWTTPSMARTLHHAHVGLLLAGVALLVGSSALVSCLTAGAARPFDSCPGEYSVGDVASVVLLTTGTAVALAGPGVVLALSFTTSGRLPRWLARALLVNEWVAGAFLAVAAWVWAGSPAAAADTVMPGVRGALVVTMLMLLVMLAVLWVAGGGRAAGLMMLAAGVGALYGAGAAATVHTAVGSPGAIPASFAWLAAAFIVAAVVLALLGSRKYLNLYRQNSQAENAPMVALRALVTDPQRNVGVIGTVGAACAGALLLGFGIYAASSLDPGVPLLQQMPELPPVDSVPAAVPIAWTLVALLVAFVGRIISVAATGIVRTIGFALIIVAVMAVLLEWGQWAASDTGAEAPSWFTTAPPWQLILGGLAVAAIVLGASAIAWSRCKGRGLAVVLSCVAGVAVLAWIVTTTQTADEVVVTAALTLPVGLVLTRLRGGLRDREARKGVAVLWDVGTFWPRWFHPFSPPTYSDTAVCGLSALLQKQLPMQPILLAPHSQGSVIAVAAILHAEQQALEEGAPSALDQLALLTYGSPATRLYGNMFPSMFSTDALLAVVEVLNRDGSVRWRNLWRQSDPIGGAIDLGHGIDELSTDAGLPDSYCRAHSGYWKEEVWSTAVAELLRTIQTGGSSNA